MFRNFRNMAIQAVRLSGEREIILTFHVRDHIDHITRRPWRKPEYFPLLSRAWAYQERYLSQRVLHFGPQEIFRECNEELRCQCSFLDCAKDANSILDLNYGVDSKSDHAVSLLRGNPYAALANLTSDVESLG